jgi:beta-galactosidase/beta-glucuronidase
VYDICDELGLYVIQTIDLPTLESLQQTSLDEKAEVWHKQQAKVLAGLRQLKTHPSVISLIFRNEYTSVLNASALTDAISHYNRDMIIAFKNRLLSQGNTYHQAFPIDWYRTPVWQQLDNPHRDSLQKAYQYVDFWVKESSTNKLYITNQYDFSNLNEMYLKWQILENGHTVAHGLIDDLNVLPKKSLETSLPFNYKSYLNKKSCVFRFSLHLKEPALWAEKNQQIAWEEFRFTSADARGVLIKKQDKK